MNRRQLLLTVPMLVLGACRRGRGESPSPEQPQAQRAPASVTATETTIPTPSVSPSPAPSPTPTPLLPQLCLVTRERGVPPSYVPPDLVALPAGYGLGVQSMRREAAEALARLIDAARGEGQRLVAVSAYRSYQQQVATLQGEIATFGPAQARRQVAEPGHSEHQLGEAVDVAAARNPELTESFGSQPEGRWLAANAARFGFVISYPAGKEAITGYVYEPWHIRFVGEEIAQQVMDSGLTLTEFLTERGMTGCPEQ